MPVTAPGLMPMLIDPDSLSNYNNAFIGQWFIGVVDTSTDTLYLLPISPDTAEAQTNTGARNRNRYASGTPFKPAAGWAGCTDDWMSRVAPGNTTHVKCCAHFQISPQDCVGFSLIKLTADGRFALMKATSNSLNAQDPNAQGAHSFSRATHNHARAMFRAGTSVDTLHQPGSTVGGAPGQYATNGTTIMSSVWQLHIKTFLATQGIPHLAQSMD